MRNQGAEFESQLDLLTFTYVKIQKPCSPVIEHTIQRILHIGSMNPTAVDLEMTGVYLKHFIINLFMLKASVFVSET